jgi:hypothetical protein
MISSILAFAAGLAAKIKLQPKVDPETAGKSDTDLAALLIAARIETAKVEAGRAEAMRLLNVTREMLIAARDARDSAKGQAQILRDRVQILERQRAELAEQIGHVLTRERAAQDRHAIEMMLATTPEPAALLGIAQRPPLQNALGQQADSALHAAMQAQHPAMRDPGHSHGGFAIPPDVAEMVRIPPNGSGHLQALAPLPADHEWWQTHPEASYRYFDCTCVPGRANAFRNQQAQARD